MKKSTFILASAAMLFALAGCEKKNPAAEEKQAEGELVEKTFYATQGGKEKTTLDFETLATLWTDGDAIKVYPEAGGEGTDFTLESGAGESAATFTGLTTLSNVYVAFYPAANAKSISGSTVTFNIPVTQTVTNAGSFDTNTVPMVGYTTDNTLAMMNVGSLFELGLKAKEGTPKVVKIELKGNNSENLAGDFTVDASVCVSGQPTATFSANGATTLTVNCGAYENEEYQGIEINASEYTYFYISIPAGVFTAGFTATLTNADGKEAEVTTANDIHKGAAILTVFEADNIEFVTPRPACQKALDADDNWIKIDEQYWLKENTRCIEYDDKSEAYLAGVTTISTIVGYAVYGPYYTDLSLTEKPEYMNDEQFGKLGMLYSWAAAMGYKDAAAAQAVTGKYSGTRQGICPNGSHIPSMSEWDALASALGGASTAGTKMKTSTGWYVPSGSSIDPGEGDDGFAALPAGMSNGDERYVEEVGKITYYWTTDSDNKNGNKANYYFINYYNPDLQIGKDGKQYAQSVRCLKD